MIVSVLQPNDINFQIDENSQVTPKIPSLLKKQNIQTKTMQTEDKKKFYQSSNSVKVISNLQRDDKYDFQSNQQLISIPISSKNSDTNKKRENTNKSLKNRAVSPLPPSSYTINSQAGIYTKEQQINRHKRIHNSSLTLNDNQLKNLNGNSEVNLQGSINNDRLPLLQSSSLIQSISYLKSNQSPQNGSSKNFILKKNKTQNNFKINNNQVTIPRKQSLAQLEQSFTKNQNIKQDQNNNQTPIQKSLSTLVVRSNKLLNNQQKGGISPFKQNYQFNQNNKKLSQNDITNNISRNIFNRATIDRNLAMFRIDEVGSENIQAIQYTEFSNYNNEEEEFKNNQNQYPSNNTVYNQFYSIPGPLNLNTQLNQTQRQANTGNNGIRYLQNISESRLIPENNQILDISSNRTSTIFNQQSNNISEFQKELISTNKDEDHLVKNNDRTLVLSNQVKQETVLRLQLMAKKNNWKDLLRSYFNQNQYTEIHLSFYDTIVEIYDSHIFNSQHKTLKFLNLSFKENKYFKDESLLFLSSIKLPGLQHVRFNLSQTSCSRLGANFLLFNFNYVPKVEIIVGDMYHHQTLLYTQEDKFIEVDFSVQQTISKSEIFSLSDILLKFNHKHLKLNLNGVNDLNYEKLKIIGKCFQEIDEIHFKLQNCQMKLQDLTQLIDGLTFNQNLQTPKDQKIENDKDMLVNKPKNYLIKKGTNDHFECSQTPRNQNLNTNNQKLENNFIKKLLIDFRQNKDEIGQDYMKIFKRFKNAETLKLYIDMEKQVKQYDAQVQAFCLGECLKDAYNCIEIAVSETHTIYSHNKEKKSMKVNASNCSISPYQLVDIQRSLNLIEDVEDMELDLSGSWQISFEHLKKLFDKLVYFNKLQRLRLNIKSVFIYELEFITLYFHLQKIKDVQIYHDFENAKLIDLTQESLKVSFKGPFSRNMQNFCVALDECLLPNIKDIQMTFFFNYGLRGDSLLRLCQSIARFPRLEKLDLNFNSCYLSFCDIVFFCNGLNNLDITLKHLKLTFTNNDNVTANSLIKLAKTLQRFPILNQIDIICETHELHLNPKDTTYSEIFDKFNTKSDIFNDDQIQRQQVQRVIPKIYQVLSHDIEQSFLQMNNLKDYLKFQQKQYFSSLENPLLQEDIENQLDEKNGILVLESNPTEINGYPTFPALIQIEEIEPPKRNKILRTIEQNWISLSFSEGVQYSDYELINLGYNLAKQEAINHIITVPQKPNVEKIFNEMKTARLAGILFSILVKPEMAFNPIQIFCDLYL